VKTLLHRYWFKFDPPSCPMGFTLGCGVTAYSREDAEELLREHVFKDEEMPRVISVVEDVDVRTLDQNHVVPNMGVVSLRGIWFPLGYDRR
jgi:hypothetical protein